MADSLFSVFDLNKPLPPANKIHALYLEYRNDFLTVERFAEYNGISVKLAGMIVDEGRDIHERDCGTDSNENRSTNK